MRTVSIAVGLLVLCASDAPATGRTVTQRSCQVSSPNGEFVLKADCQKKTVEIFRKLQVNVVPQVLWSFEYDVQHDEFALSDDGETVVILWWPRRGQVKDAEGTALRFWQRQKGEFKTHKLRELCDDISGVGEVPMFGFNNGAWFRYKPQPRDDKLVVITTDNHQCEFSMTTGELLDRQRHFVTPGMMCIGILIAILVVVVGAIAVVVVILAGGSSLLVWLLARKR